MASDVRVEVRVTLDGYDVPGFAGALVHRARVPVVEVFRASLPGQTEPTVNPAAAAVQAGSVEILRVEKPLTVYFGTNHEEGMTIEAGGFIVLAGVSLKARGVDMENNGDEDAGFFGLLGGV